MSYRTFELLEKSRLHYTPRTALIVYATEDQDYYLETRAIHPSGKMGAGVPLTRNCIAELAKSFSEDQAITPYGYLPKNMLLADNRIGYQRYIWYNPPEKRMMYFSKQLAIPDGEYYIPGTIYEVVDNTLNLYVFKGKCPKVKLFQAPFLNTTDGSVCLGNAKLDYPGTLTYTNFITYWEKKFWLTEFTHLGGRKNPTRSNLITIIKKSVNGFNHNELLPINQTLKDLLK